MSCGSRALSRTLTQPTSCVLRRTYLGKCKSAAKKPVAPDHVLCPAAQPWGLLFLSFPPSANPPAKKLLPPRFPPLFQLPALLGHPLNAPFFPFRASLPRESGALQTLLGVRWENLREPWSRAGASLSPPRSCMCANCKLPSWNSG